MVCQESWIGLKDLKAGQTCKLSSQVLLLDACHEYTKKFLTHLRASQKKAQCHAGILSRSHHRHSEAGNFQVFCCDVLQLKDGFVSRSAQTGLGRFLSFSG